MRVLFVQWSWPSHHYPTVPAGWALRAAGHDVLVACQPALVPVVRRTGLPAVPTGHDVDVTPILRGYTVRPAAPAGPPGRRTGRPPRALAMFRAVAEAMIADLVTVARGWSPDLVVYEPTALAGPVAAAVAGVPAVRHLYGPDILSPVSGLLRDAAAALARRYSADVPDGLCALTIDPGPPGLIPPGPYGPRQGIRSPGYTGPETAVPALPPRSPGRPRVCVTSGSTLPGLDPRLFLAPGIARALSGPDLEVVLALGAGQRQIAGPLPDGVLVTEAVPLRLILPGCDAVVAHGGAATLLAALAHGLPSLLIPCLPDHSAQAARVAGTGAAMVLPPDAAQPVRVLEATNAIVHEPAYREPARRLAEQMNAQPSPARIVPLVEAVSAGEVPAPARAVVSASSPRKV